MWRGVILAGGTGSRLWPLTKATNKHLLPVYNRPMIYYPIAYLRAADITNICIVSGREHSGDFCRLLGDGSELGVNIYYAVQREASGIAGALSLTKNFAANSSVAVLLGDNVFENPNFLQAALNNWKSMLDGAHLFLAEVSSDQLMEVGPDGQRRAKYGIVELRDRRVVSIEEKPTTPKSGFAVTGAYLFGHGVFSILPDLKPSWRGELEITDVNLHYLKEGTLTATILSGWWGDAGEDHNALWRVGDLVRTHPAAQVFPELQNH